MLIWHELGGLHSGEDLSSSQYVKIVHHIYCLREDILDL